MDTRNRRIELLKMLLAQQELGSQEEILRALAKRGFKMTQASMSRDLKQMKAVKITGKDGEKFMHCPTRQPTSVSHNHIRYKECLSHRDFSPFISLKISQSSRQNLVMPVRLHITSTTVE